ncbi:MAG: aldo/keto reductase [Oscillospiraceae bacterium]|jgi:predicted aldo/keto reductase-like oxidoreductase|nr:aldo/keto reductase [Oscillospiraceae bacterium]
MAEKYLGESIPKLGFGFMRLPRQAPPPGAAPAPGGFGGFGAPPSFDDEQINKMVDHFLANGFTYFDTAFVYGGSEEALSRSLIKRYPDREKYQIASKLNLGMVNDRKGMEDQFNTTMQRLETPYLDFYLIHGLSGQSIQKADDLGAWDYVKELKEAGKVKHYGLSFHGTPEELDGIFTKHPDAEFVQIQLNYLDWDSEDVQSRKVYEVARKHNKPVTVMEPLKGGKLASETFAPADDFKAADPNASSASWGLRFVADKEGLITILSGMSTYEQLVDNVKTFKGLKPLTDEDRALIQKAADTIKLFPGIPCTGCNYCSPNCPQKINIPALINIYNEYLVYRDPDNVGGFMYNFQQAKAKDCVACGTCTEHCPQHIDIPDVLAKLSPLVDK